MWFEQNNPRFGGGLAQPGVETGERLAFPQRQVQIGGVVNREPVTLGQVEDSVVGMRIGQPHAHTAQRGQKSICVGSGNAPAAFGVAAKAVEAAVGDVAERGGGFGKGRTTLGRVCVGGSC